MFRALTTVCCPPDHGFDAVYDKECHNVCESPVYVNEKSEISKKSKIPEIYRSDQRYESSDGAERGTPHVLCRLLTDGGRVPRVVRRSSSRHPVGRGFCGAGAGGPCVRRPRVPIRLASTSAETPTRSIDNFGKPNPRHRSRDPSTVHVGRREDTRPPARQNAPGAIDS
jgi:hypothetical protein